MSDFSLSFSLSYDNSTGLVTLALNAQTDQPQASSETIYAELSALSYDQYFIFEDKIDEAVSEANRLRKTAIKHYKQYQSNTDEQLGTSPKQIIESINEPPSVFVIAERRDAKIRIEVSENKHKAFLSIDAPRGGELATENMIKQSLEALGICHGIDKQAIQQACCLESCDQVLIAKASKPRRGKPSQFKALVGEQGHAPFHNADIFLVVEPGTPLIKRTKPGAGLPGTDVYGNTIPAIPGDVLAFSTDIEGASVSEKSSNTLVATRQGHPVFRDRGVSISEVLSLENIDTSSSDIEFDGSVFVEGDIADGVKLTITGNLAVKGDVGKANITAGGSIFIHRGLIGAPEDDESGNSHLYAANIDAKESVYADFITHAQVTAGKHIISNDYIHNSNLKAGHKIVVGQSSDKGELSGGSAQAFDLIAANVLGNKDAPSTYLKVGAEGRNIFDLRQINIEKRLKAQNTEDINKAREKIGLLKNSVGLMTPQMNTKLEKLNHKLTALQLELNELNEQEETIKRILMKSKKSRVSAQQSVYRNTVVSILGSEYKINEDSKGGSFRFNARQVIFESYSS